MGMILFFINPVRQLDKMKDATRQHDFEEIKTSLDAYYNDHNCYPASIPFGAEWTEDGTTYMKKVPQDIECSTKGKCYSYEPDPEDTCSQWYGLFGRLAVTPQDQFRACSVPASCLPVNYTSSGYNSCFVAGSYDCSVLHNIVLPDIQTVPTQAISTPTPTPTQVILPTNTLVPTQVVLPTNTPMPTPTPLPTEPVSCTKIYKCILGQGSQNICNRVADGTGDYCGFFGCSGGQCCQNQCQ